MMNNTLNVNISDPTWEELISGIEEKSQKIFDEVLSQLKPDFLEGKKEVFANLQLGNDEEVHQLNLEFREIDKATNILTFANIDDDDFENYIEKSAEIELGDMIISSQTMLKESKEQEISLINHYTHILIHGILHLLGYDHIIPEDATEMESLEIELLKSFNIANPYEEEK